MHNISVLRKHLNFKLKDLVFNNYRRVEKNLFREPEL